MTSIATDLVEDLSLLGEAPLATFNKWMNDRATLQNINEKRATQGLPPYVSTPEGLKKQIPQVSHPTIDWETQRREALQGFAEATEAIQLEREQKISQIAGKAIGEELVRMSQRKRS